VTRKDSEVIARTLNANTAPLDLVLDFADMLEEGNPRFDRVHFVQAATGNLEKQQSFEARNLALAAWDG